MTVFARKEELDFREKYKVGGKIQTKYFEQLDSIDKNNVTKGNPGKHRYLGRILTIAEVCYEKDGRSFCTVKEDGEAFCWFVSMISEKPLLPTLKQGTLPYI
jgi:hypothetical protein